MPRCKNCNDKFDPVKFLQKFCGQNKDCLVAEALYNLDKIKQQKDKEWKERKSEMKPIVHAKKYKSSLQTEINKLARMIDEKHGVITCIDCSKRFGKQIDAGHFHSVGHNASIRYNLHNIHSQKSDCNQNGLGGGKQLGYYRGLIERYGIEYADRVDVEIPKKYTYIGLNENDIVEKLRIVRSIIKHFDTYEFQDAIVEREMFNRIIGIYK